MVKDFVGIEVNYSLGLAFNLKVVLSTTIDLWHKSSN